MIDSLGDHLKIDRIWTMKVRSDEKRDTRRIKRKEERKRIITWR